MFPTRRIITSGGDVFRDEYSLAFDGTNDYITLPPSNVLFNGTNVTVAVWFKVDDTDAATLFHNQKDAGSTHFALIANYKSSGAAAGHVGLLTWNGLSHDWLDYDGNVDADGKWHHLVGTVSNGAQRLYLDGIEVATPGEAAFGTNASANLSYIGSLNGASNFLGGNVSEVVQYDTVLAPSQVKTIYNNREPYNHKEGITKKSGNLKAWWRMGDGALDGFSRTTASELSGNGQGAIQDMILPSLTDVVTGWTNVDFDTCTISGLDVSSAISDGSASHEFSSNAIDATAGDLLEISFTIAGSLIPSNDKLLFKLSPNADLNSAVFDCKINAVGEYHFYAAFTATDSSSYVGIRSAAEASNFSMTNFRCRKFEGNVGQMTNMAADDFEGDTP